MEHVIRKLFASTFLRTQRARSGMSQDEFITFRFGPCLRRSQTNHDNVDAKAPPANPPTKDKPSVARKTETDAPPR